MKEHIRWKSWISICDDIVVTSQQFLNIVHDSILRFSAFYPAWLFQLINSSFMQNIKHGMMI